MIYLYVFGFRILSFRSALVRFLRARSFRFLTCSAAASVEGQSDSAKESDESDQESEEDDLFVKVCRWLL
jgi:hypothetical protein